MKNKESVKWLSASFIFLMISFNVLAQYPAGEHAHESGNFDIVFWFGILELPFLFVCIFYSFKTAAALKGGVFGSGMNFLAWGFLVMALGHIAMQIHHIFGFDVFRDVFGYIVGNIFWFVALIITWGLSALGFYKIYKASSKG